MRVGEGVGVLPDVADQVGDAVQRVGAAFFVRVYRSGLWCFLPAYFAWRPHARGEVVAPFFIACGVVILAPRVYLSDL